MTDEPLRNLSEVAVTECEGLWPEIHHLSENAGADVTDRGHMSPPVHLQAEGASKTIAAW